MTTQTQELGFELPWEVHEVNRWLKEGNPTLGWRGDPRLSLQMGIVTANRSGIDPKTGKYHRKGDNIMWQWQVWRHCESGKDELLLQRNGKQLMDIIPALIKMDPRTPGFENVMDTVEREDAIVQRERQKAIGEAHGEQAEHLWKLVADRQNGPSTFRQMPGRNPDKQM